MKQTALLIPLFSLFVFGLCCLLGACNDQAAEKTAANRTERYLCLSHTRVCGYGPPGISSARYQRIDFSAFDALLLGGDLSCESSKHMETLNHLDSIFQLNKSNTLWAQGNHDDSRPHLISLVTKRPDFYTYHQSGNTFAVLNTQRDEGHILGAQLEMLQHIADTIEDSHHLIVLTHKLLWMYNHAVLAQEIKSTSNAELCEEDWCLQPNNFYEAVYPLLLKVKRKGIRVMCIAGDIGINSSQFDFETIDGIRFLATGVNDNIHKDKALVLILDTKEETMKWQFVKLSDLPQKISI
ncbi:MAG: hypothetical protein AAFP19_02015 [Bacteroidota bacterium]